MKKFLSFAGIVLAAILINAQAAQAQYVPKYITFSHGDYRSDNGRVLTNAELNDLFGEELCEDTLQGARRQYYAGRALLISGGVTMGIGMASMISGIVLFADRTEWFVDDKGKVDYYSNDKRASDTGIILTTVGSVVTALGFTVLSIGTPLYFIGKGRMNWLADEYNKNARPIAVRVGNGRYGTGLIVDF